MNEASEGDQGREGTESTSARAVGADRLHALEVIVGLFAGLAALIYITGGAALGLRLLFAGLPSLPVGQLPREFLFSLGAAQVVVPAVALAIVVGLIEIGQRHQGLVFGHLPWSEAKQRRGLGRTYIAYYAAVPFLLIAPGLAVAVITDNAVDKPTSVVVVLAIAVAVAIGLVAWCSSAWSSRIKDRRERPKGEELRNRYLWAGLLGGGIMPLVFAVWLSLEVDDARYVGVIGAWLVSLLFALLVVCGAPKWARGTGATPPVHSGCRAHRSPASVKTSLAKPRRPCSSCSPGPPRPCS